MCEEYLRVGSRLVGKENNEGRALLVEDGTENKVNLGKTGCATLVLKSMLQA